MEDSGEIIRLETKTDPEAIRRDAAWCGLRPGLRVLDVGCGSGKGSSLLHEMIQPGGALIGFDFSTERIPYARQHYGQKPGIHFHVRDFTTPLADMGQFDLIWVRFVLEYHRTGSPGILKNLATCLKPGGHLCLMDLDHNCLSHYELPERMEHILFQLMSVLEKRFDFDPYAGRKLYAYLYDLDFEDIELDLRPHHLLYGNIKNEDIFNWTKKVEVVSGKTKALFEDYPGGHKAFFSDFEGFFLNPRRFTYTPLILCKGKKPSSSSHLD